MERLLFLSSCVPLAARLSLTFKDSLFSLALGISIFGVVLGKRGHWMNHTKPLNTEYSSSASIQLPVPPPIDAQCSVGQLGTLLSQHSPACLTLSCLRISSSWRWHDSTCCCEKRSPPWEAPTGTGEKEASRLGRLAITSPWVHLALLSHKRLRL